MGLFEAWMVPYKSLVRDLWCRSFFLKSPHCVMQCIASVEKLTSTRNLVVFFVRIIIFLNSVACARAISLDFVSLILIDLIILPIVLSLSGFCFYCCPLCFGNERFQWHWNMQRCLQYAVCINWKTFRWLKTFEIWIQESIQHPHQHTLSHFNGMSLIFAQRLSNSKQKHMWDNYGDSIRTFAINHVCGSHTN